LTDKREKKKRQNHWGTPIGSLLLERPTGGGPNKNFTLQKKMRPPESRSCGRSKKNKREDLRLGGGLDAMGLGSERNWGRYSSRIKGGKTLGNN